MDIYADIISKAVVVFFIYIILNRALSNLSYSKKYYILFFISLGISVLFYLAYLYDKNTNTIYSPYRYFSYIGSSAIFALYSLIKTVGKTRKNQFKKYNHYSNKKVERISRAHYKEYLYLLFEYKGEYLLKQTKQTYSGMNIRLKKGKFHDEEIKRLVERYNGRISDVTMYGEYVDSKNKEVYYCYLITLDEEINLKKYKWYQFSRIRFLEFADFDKEIVDRLLLKDNFEINK